MRNLAYVIILLIFSSCAVSKQRPYKKYGQEQLKQDYSLFRNILEAQHPGLYWYTPKDSMDYYFRKGESMLKDSMNETSFRNVLTYVVSQIRCGHTTIRPSKAYARQGVARYFPLILKAWSDTAIITSNLSRRDSNIRRGYLLTAINNKPVNSILDSMFQHLSADGYNLTHKYQTVSNRGVFGAMYTSLYGARPKYKVTYIDTLGTTKTDSVSLYVVFPDSTRRDRPPSPKPSKRERRKRNLQVNRSLSFDTALAAATMELSTFTRGYRLRRFFKSSFKKMARSGTQNLIIDLRSNGGGSVTNSNLLTKYIAEKPFKIADSLYALHRRSPYSKYQNDRFGTWLFMNFMTHRKKDGHYHFNLFERKHFKPKRKNHFNGQVYVLTGGNTFSASTLFAGAVMKQTNVHIVGEETGGGAYGNNAWLIPDVTLPNTKVRFRLPLFRLVVDKNIPKDGRGIMPEVDALPSVEDIRLNKDFKLEKVYELIRKQPPQN